MRLRKPDADGTRKGPPGEAAPSVPLASALPEGVRERVSDRPAERDSGNGEKYQRILDAAVEVFAERGYFHAPVSAIAARAGVADGTIYLYFKNKDEVLRAVIDAVFGRFYQQVEELFTTLDDPREQLECIARLHLQSARDNRSMAILMQTEMRQSATFIAEFSHHHLARYIGVVREVVRRGQQKGVFRRDVSDGIVAHVMFGAIDELLSSAIFRGREYDPKTTAAQVLDVILRGIGAGEEA